MKMTLLILMTFLLVSVMWSNISYQEPETGERVGQGNSAVGRAMRATHPSILVLQNAVSISDESVMAITGDQSDSVKKTEAELTQNQLDEMRKLYFENVEIRTESNPTYPPEGLVLTRYMAPEYLEARLGESDPQFSQKPRANDTVFYPIGLRTKYVFDFYMSRAWYLEIDLVFEGPEAEVLREANSMVGSMSNLPEVWLEIRDEHGAPLRFPPPLRERTDMSASIHYTQAGFYSEELGEGKIRLLQPYGVALAEKPEPGIYTVRFLSPGSNIELLRRQGFGSLPVTLVDDSWHTFELDYASLERAPRKNTEEE